MISSSISVNPDKHKSDMLGLALSMSVVMHSNFKNFGMLPMCRKCPDKTCVQYNAPGLTFFQCEKGIWRK